ncbi:MAG: hypothetical protein IRY95_10055 [Clostridia bacterium]|nr:hypothetical protein [Clostridia bacterium]
MSAVLAATVLAGAVAVVAVPSLAVSAGDPWPAQGLTVGAAVPTTAVAGLQTAGGRTRAVSGADTAPVRSQDLLRSLSRLDLSLLQGVPCIRIHPVTGRVAVDGAVLAGLARQERDGCYGVYLMPEASSSLDWVLAHELAHAVQHRRGRGWADDDALDEVASRILGLPGTVTVR